MSSSLFVLFWDPYFYLCKLYLYHLYIHRYTHICKQNMCEMRETDMEGGEGKKGLTKERMGLKKTKGWQRNCNWDWVSGVREAPASVVSVSKAPLPLTITPFLWRILAPVFLRNPYRLRWLGNCHYLSFPGGSQWHLLCKYLRDWTRWKSNRFASNMEPNSLELKSGLVTEELCGENTHFAIHSVNVL